MPPADFRRRRFRRYAAIFAMPAAAPLRFR
jgi:hypothetical protein